MAAPSLWDSYLAYLRTQGFETDEVYAAVLAAYRDDGGPAQLAEHLVDLDEGLQEWRYRHVKMVERTIGDKPGTGGLPGAAQVDALPPGVPRAVGRASRL